MTKIVIAERHVSVTGHRKQKDFFSKKNTCIQICKMIIIIDAYFRYITRHHLDILFWVTIS